MIFGSILEEVWEGWAHDEEILLAILVVRGVVLCYSPPSVNYFSLLDWTPSWYYSAATPPPPTSFPPPHPSPQASSS